MRAPEQALPILKKNWPQPGEKGAGSDGVSTNLRELRALEVLERIGTVAAKQFVAGIAGEPAESLLTREAKLVLDRWPANVGRR